MLLFLFYFLASAKNFPPHLVRIPISLCLYLLQPAVHSLGLVLPMPSTSLFIEHEPAAIARCTWHEQTFRYQSDYRRCTLFLMGDTKYRLKFGDTVSFFPEAMMQKRFASVAQKDPTAPLVPQVHHIFHHGSLTYAFIEDVETVQVSQDIFCKKVAAAVLWLRRQPSEPNVLGPVGSGRACHVIFKNKYAPQAFTGVVALERFLNKVCPLLASLPPC